MCGKFFENLSGNICFGFYLSTANLSHILESEIMETLALSTFYGLVTDRFIAPVADNQLTSLYPAKRFRTFLLTLYMHLDCLPLRVSSRFH